MFKTRPLSALTSHLERGRGRCRSVSTRFVVLRQGQQVPLPAERPRHSQLTSEVFSWCLNANGKKPLNKYDKDVYLYKVFLEIANS